MQVNLTNGQIQQAAKSSLEFFSDKELKVPVQFAMSGDLMVLQQLLMSLATGQTVLTKNPEAGDAQLPTPPPGLKAVGEDPRK